ncbi:hypothetical protein BC826DRAFT_968632 [Russula brevipes]|nr:hypothetical protein BC826DRAFT_968632 [Russula brevipes]
MCPYRACWCTVPIQGSCVHWGLLQCSARGAIKAFAPPKGNTWKCTLRITRGKFEGTVDPGPKVKGIASGVLAKRNQGGWGEKRERKTTPGHPGVQGHERDEGTAHRKENTGRKTVDLEEDGGMGEITSGACTKRVEIMHTLPDAVSCSHRARDCIVEMCPATWIHLYPHMVIQKNGRGMVDDVGDVDRGCVGHEEGSDEGNAVGTCGREIPYREDRGKEEGSQGGEELEEALGAQNRTVEAQWGRFGSSPVPTTLFPGGSWYGTCSRHTAAIIRVQCRTRKVYRLDCIEVDINVIVRG